MPRKTALYAQPAAILYCFVLNSVIGRNGPIMKKMNRSVALMMAIILTFSICTTGALAASNSLSNFKETRTYEEGQFADISTHWSKDNVIKAYRVGIIDGYEDGTFVPDGTLSIAAAIKLAACLNSIYKTGTQEFKNSVPWYKEYLDYCVKNKIATDNYGDYNKNITRAQFAELFANSLPSDALSSINTIEDNAVLDVPMTMGCATAVYKLYRAGILTGDAGTNAYRPNDSIRRSEVAAILSRMMDKSVRQSLTLKVPTNLTAEQIYAKCSSSVFYIEALNASGEVFSQGSGVFISADGKAVTNLHVINRAQSARIKTLDGKTYEVEGIYDYNRTTDLARIKIKGSGFTPAVIGDSRNLKTGADIFTIGNPLGLESTISQGIISTASRLVDGMNYIQITAPISSGSSGGALLDSQGRLIGITSASYIYGQNLNLAVPIHRMEELSTSKLTKLSVAFPFKGYAKHPSVPDFGAYFNVPLYLQEDVQGGTGYIYKASAIPGGIEDADYEYFELLWDCGFSYYDSDYIEGLWCDMYINGSYTIAVATSMDLYDSGVRYYMVMVVNA